MGLDVYGLTTHRDVSTIRQFLDEFADLPASEDRGDEELAIEPLDPARSDSESAIEWEPAHTLTHIIERGLAYPRRAFTIYTVSRHPSVERAILCFTHDDQLVLGLSLYNDMYPDDVAISPVLAQHLMSTYQCHLGVILPETPPPMSESEFRRAIASDAYTPLKEQ